MEIRMEKTGKDPNWRRKKNKQQSLAEKKLQSEIPKQEEDRGWLKYNTDFKKTSSLFTLQQEIIETRTRK